MIAEKAIILKKIVRSDIKEKFYYKKKHEKYYFS